MYSIVMRYAVIQLCEQGRRLSREEIAAALPVIGDLEVSDWRQGNAAKRILRKAELFDRMPQCNRGLLRPLFDPAIIRMTTAWMVLRGWQIDCDPGPSLTPREYAQEWLVRPVTAEMEAEQGPTARQRMPHEG